MRVLWLLVLAVVACGDDGRPVDAAVADARYIDPEPYYRDCDGRTPCPAPYVCTEVPRFALDAGVDDVCLVPCGSNDECGLGCCCNERGCGSSVGAEGFCSCS
jgi:hypothetical protein